MTPPISFFAHGIPKAQPRPRAFARKFGAKWQARVYDAGTAENWKSCIAEAAKPHIPATPLTGPLSCIITFFLPRPKSHYRADGTLKFTAPKYHISRPDADNYSKAALDALTQLGMWGDDSQVSESTTRKLYGGPGATITIQQIEDTI